MVDISETSRNGWPHAGQLTASGLIWWAHMGHRTSSAVRSGRGTEESGTVAFGLHNTGPDAVAESANASYAYWHSLHHIIALGTFHGSFAPILQLSHLWAKEFFTGFTFTCPARSCLVFRPLQKRPYNEKYQAHNCSKVARFQFLDAVELRWTPKTGPQVKMDFRWSAGEKKADYESKTETA